MYFTKRYVRVIIAIDFREKFPPSDRKSFQEMFTLKDAWSSFLPNKMNIPLN